MSNAPDLKEDDSGDELSSANDFVQIYMITIDIIGAYNLEKADLFGLSDPYCKVSAFDTSYTTCTIRKSLNPTWNERVELTFFNDPKTIKFEIFDFDGKLGGKDDDIGDCEFHLKPNIYNSKDGYKGKIALENCKSGEIEINICARKLLPLELEKRAKDLQETTAKNTDIIATHDAETRDLNKKNEILENDMQSIGADIKGLNEEIPEREEEQKQDRERYEELDGENKKICQDIKGIEETYNDLEKEENEVIKAKNGVIKEWMHLRQEIQEMEKKKNEKKEEENVSAVYSDKFLEADYEDPNYGLLANDKKAIETAEVFDANSNECCSKCIVL